MKLKKIIQYILILFVLSSCQTNLKLNNGVSLNLDPALNTGVLDNGVSYFIQENQKPENRIELRLIVNAGSILEEDDQKGLAHFVEHMAFNGTKNFPKDELIKYLESLGMGFGPEINASTSFDETIYKLSIPADNEEALDKALLILEDWAHNITFEDEEIEKERGVIVEEWRSGLGVNDRYLNTLLPIFLKDSKYAQRLTIGDMDVIKNCDPQRLRDYYQKWYTPNNIAVAVVGNINVESIKNKVEERFNYKFKGLIQKRPTFKTPILNRTDIKIVTDPEQTYSEVSMFIKKPKIHITSVEEYRAYINEVLNILMFNSRMEEIYTKENSPFLYAGGNSSSFVRNVGVSSIFAQVNSGQIDTGFKALFQEIEKINQHGFSNDELELAKSRIQMILENMYNERENTESESVISSVISYFLEGEIVMDIKEEVDILNNFLSEISLDEVNKYSSIFFNGTDKTIIVYLPESEQNIPSEADLKDILVQVQKSSYEKREDIQSNKGIFNKELKPGKVVNIETDNLSNITTVILENGINVLFKKTDFKDDEILFSAVSFGGLSLVDDSEFYSGSISTSLVNLSGLNNMDAITLKRELTGKNATVSPWISNYTEGLNGSSSVKDLETLFQLINLYFLEPEFSQESLNVIFNNLTQYIKNRENSPKTIFNDRVNELISSNHFRSKPMELESLNEISLAEAEQVYNERFKDPSDFYFVFTGNFEQDRLIYLIETYLGSLETFKINELPKDLNINLPKGIIDETVVKGIDEQSVVEIIFNDDKNISEEEEFGLDLLSSYLQEDLRLIVREKLSGTYGVSVFSNVRQYPINRYLFGIYFGCEPSRVEELTNVVFKRLEEIKNGDVDEEILQSVINNYSRNMELNLKDNSYWINSITSNLLLKRDFKNIYTADTSFVTKEFIVKLTNNYVNSKKYIKVSLLPE